MLGYYDNHRCLVLRKSGLLARLLMTLPSTPLYSVFTCRIEADVTNFVAVLIGRPY